MQMEKSVKQTHMTLLVSGGEIWNIKKIMKDQYLCGKSTYKPISYYNKYIPGGLR